MRIRLLIMAIMMWAGGWATVGRAQTGTWQMYQAYHEVKEIAKAHQRVYVLASGGLYVYNEADESLQTFDKTTGLTDSGIAHIGYNKAAGRLVIVYENQNIDLMDDQGAVINISAYHSATLTEDKTVNHIAMAGDHALLSTGFGLLRINVRKAEISATYKLGFRINYCYTTDKNIYAAGEEAGLYEAPLTANLNDKSAWKRVGDYQKPAATVDETLLERIKRLQPGGPRSNRFYTTLFRSGRLYGVAGGFNYLTDDLTPGRVQVMDAATGTWSVYDEAVKEKTGIPYVAALSLALDPTRPGRAFVAARSGLFEFDNGTVVHAHNSTNSLLTTSVNERYTIIPGLTFDATGSLWFLNCYSPNRNLMEIKPSGEWVSHFKQELMDADHSLYFMRNAFFDSRGLLWFVNDHWSVPSIICYDPRADKVRVVSRFTNTDGNSLAVNYVHCAVEDMDGRLWIGTNVGPLVLPALPLTDGDPMFEQVKVARNDGTTTADYLLGGVDITAMAVDGANRKWMGTNGNGVYLIGSDNTEEIHHFTKANSPLPSDNITSIAIDGATGNVYFATDKGLCSYRADATSPAENMTAETVYAFPNPVAPDYTGPITVRGLTADADVKIVTSSGHLVYQGRSNGGTFTWPGLDSRGRRVPSGVYSVLTATSDGKKGVVCRVAVVR